jgi:predicted metalloprotease
MDLDDQEASSNIEDRRGMGIGAIGGGLGLGTIAIGVIAYLLGFDPGMVMNLAQQVQAPHQLETHPAPRGVPSDRLGQFSAKVLGSTEAVWGDLFRQSNATYRPPTLVLYERATRSSCGIGQSAMGPFYCPSDEKLYLDLSFFRDLQTRFRAPGDFAQAYVIAHEVGHHVQKLTGTAQKVAALRGRVPPEEANRMSVRMELQADCYAGVWGHYAGTRKQVQPGEIEGALRAASAIGDDRLQQETRGHVVPESFTHGSSAQRVRWFTRGLQSGRPGACDTFSAAAL